VADEIVQRFDVAKVKLTPQGGRVASAHIARAGILEYRQPDGSIRRELRPEDEVFHPDSLKSFAHATLTDDHPGGLVGPDNWKRVTIGHVAGEPSRDGDFVAASLHVQHGDSIKKAENGELVELSSGYTCILDKTPGEWRGQRYDAVQRQIRGNHVALLPEGWGRAGPDVRLRLDSAGAMSGIENDSYVPPVSGTQATTTQTQTTTPPAATTSTPAATSAAREDAGELAALRAENARLLKEAEARNDAAAEREEQTRIDARVAERVNLITIAKPLLGDAWRADGKSEDAIRREVIAKLEPDFELPDAKEDGAEDYVRGAFKSLSRRADRATKALNHTRRASPGHAPGAGSSARADSTTATGSGADGEAGDPAQGEPNAVLDARDAMITKQKDAWKKDRGGRRGDRGRKE